jgi:hypothetical protein
MCDQSLSVGGRYTHPVLLAGAVVQTCVAQGTGAGPGPGVDGWQLVTKAVDNGHRSASPEQMYAKKYAVSTSVPALSNVPDVGADNQMAGTMWLATSITAYLCFPPRAASPE